MSISLKSHIKTIVVVLLLMFICGMVGAVIHSMWRGDGYYYVQGWNAGYKAGKGLEPVVSTNTVISTNWIEKGTSHTGD